MFHRAAARARKKPPPLKAVFVTVLWSIVLKMGNDMLPCQRKHAPAGRGIPSAGRFLGACALSCCTARLGPRGSRCVAEGCRCTCREQDTFCEVASQSRCAQPLHSWLTPQKAAAVRAKPGQSQESLPCLPYGCRDPKHLGCRPLLLSDH